MDYCYYVPEPEGNIELEEIKDFFVEQRAAMYELELYMWWRIGKIASEMTPKQLKKLAHILRKHLSELKTAIKFYRKYPHWLDFSFDKAYTWSKMKKEYGLAEKRGRVKPSQLIAVIKDRRKAHEEALKSAASDDFIKFLRGRMAEDDDVLKKVGYSEKEKGS